METFLSCDWGTSYLRLRLIRKNDLSIVAEEITNQGIANTYEMWQQPENNNLPRQHFYILVIKKLLDSLSKKSGLSLGKISVVLSGMASSNIGMIELPYKELPFDLSGSDLEVKVLQDESCPNKFIVISGARTDNDAMRGEETKIIGCSAYLKNNDGEQILIIPGTHSKHVHIKDDSAVNVKTFMTGELFDLLSTKSILTNSMEKGSDFFNPAHQQNFIEGVKAGQSSNLLHEIFLIRTNDLLKNISKQQNYFYLSGLLIGTELKDIKPRTQIFLVSNISHIAYYTLACNILKININKTIDADQALIKGQNIILSTYYPDASG